MANCLEPPRGICDPHSTAQPVGRCGPETPRVLHVVRSLEIGGLERLVANLIRARGFAATQVACLCTAGAFAQALQGEGARVQTYAGQDSRRGRLSWLKRVVQEFQPDVIHCHSIYAFLFGGLIAKLMGVKCLVLTKHGQAIPATPLVRWLFPWLLKSASVICVSPDIRDMLVARYAPAICDLYYIRNGIDLAEFVPCANKATARAALGLPPHALILGTVGRLCEEKGFDVLIDAVHLAASAHRSFLLVIVGDGSCKPQLIAQVRKLGLTERVSMLGERRDVAELLGCFDGFVLSSRSEGQPVSVIEAMACGLPVIATDVGGISSVVQDRVTGCLVPSDNPVALAGAIEEFIQRPDHFRELGERAEVVARRDFDIATMLEAYERVYQAADERLERRWAALSQRSAS